MDNWLHNLHKGIKFKFKDELHKIPNDNNCLNHFSNQKDKLRCAHNVISKIKLIDEDRSREVLEECGKSCISQLTLNRIIEEKDNFENLDQLLLALNSFGVGGGNLYKKGNKVYASYKACGCFISELNKDIHLCNCSRGWFLKLFETILGKEVQVELIQSIIGGSETCEFVIHI